MDPGDRVVVAAAPGEPDQLDVRMAGQQPDQLGADVAGRPDDPDPDPARAAGRVDAARGAREEPGRADPSRSRERLESGAHVAHDYTVARMHSRWAAEAPRVGPLAQWLAID